jgi:hypothetical protein
MELSTKPKDISLAQLYAVIHGISSDIQNLLCHKKLCSDAIVVHELFLTYIGPIDPTTGFFVIINNNDDGSNSQYTMLEVVVGQFHRIVSVAVDGTEQL